MKYPPLKYQPLNYQIDPLAQQSHPVKDYHFFCLQFNPALTIRRILSKIFSSSLSQFASYIQVSKIVCVYFILQNWYCAIRRLRLLSSDCEEYFRNLTNQSCLSSLHCPSSAWRLSIQRSCETPTICQREQVSRFFNWPIIVCVLLKCLLFFCRHGS